MTREKLAVALDGNEYMSEISGALEREARAAGFIVIFGYSDDNVELRGAVDDEIGANEGTKFLIDAKGVLPCWDDFCHNEEEEAEFKKYFERKPNAKQIEAVWCDGGESSEYAWSFKTEIPHSCFDILEDGDKFCRGIVIDVKDLKA